MQTLVAAYSTSFPPLPNIVAFFPIQGTLEQRELPFYFLTQTYVSEELCEGVAVSTLPSNPSHH